MHYKNGRPAKAGDKVIDTNSGHTGILHSPISGSTTCNGRLAVTTPSDPFINLKDCLHIDDVKAATIPDTSPQP